MLNLDGDLLPFQFEYFRVSAGVRTVRTFRVRTVRDEMQLQLAVHGKGVSLSTPPGSLSRLEEDFCTVCMSVFNVKPTICRSASGS
jgi:hypothetical protein